MTSGSYLEKFIDEKLVEGCLSSGCRNYRATLSLFVSSVGLSLPVGCLTYDAEQKLPFKFSAHMLRHNYATRVCQAYIVKHGKADIEYLSIYLGHESKETTLRYIHCAMKQLAMQQAVSLFDENLFSLGTEALAV